MPFVEYPMEFPQVEDNGDGTITLHWEELKIHKTYQADDPMFDYETKETAADEAVRFWMQKNGVQTFGTLLGLPNALDLFENTTATLKVWVP